MFSYKIVDNFFSNNECNEILNFCNKKLIIKNAEVVNYLNDGFINEKTRKSKLGFFIFSKEFPVLNKKIENFVLNEILIKGHKLNFGSEPFQFTKYNEGDFFNWHRDSFPKESYDEYGRYCSLVLQLNNNYSEGNLEIKTKEGEVIKIQNKTGTLIIFLSELEHRVTPIESGERFTLVNWIGLKKEESSKKTLL